MKSLKNYIEKDAVTIPKWMLEKMIYMDTDSIMIRVKE